MMLAIRVVGQKTANPTLKFAPSGRWDAPLSYTLCFTDKYMTYLIDEKLMDWL